MFLLCYSRQSTPLLFELMRFSISTFWSSKFSYSTFDNWQPLYPFSELMRSSLSIVFGPWCSLAYFFILSLNSHSNLSQVASLSKLCCSTLSLSTTFVVTNNGDWCPFFHFFQLSPLSELYCSFIFLSTLVATSNGNQHPIFSSFSILSSLWALLLFSLFKHSHSF